MRLEQRAARQDHVVRPDVVVPERDHLLQLVGALRGEVLPLGGIRRHVEELPVALAEGLVLPADLPVPLPDRAVAEDLPGEIVLVRPRRLRLARQHRAPGLADERGQPCPS